MIATLQSVLTSAVLILGQAGPGPAVDVDLGTGLAGGATGAFLTTLVVGLVMIAVAPTYTERMMASLLADPVESLVYGLVCLVVLVVLILGLVITIVGILVVVPLVLLAVLVWAIGSVIGYLAIADRLVGRRDSWLLPLLVGATINGLLALTGIGGLVAFGIGAAGFGTVIRSLLD
ncbi:hypothetical protein OB955_09080 [Halobacteria archaeon AArc-m2/3/4]|uniref:DUF8173 domain-containing protein n=1 Tax=Natronoglomus mannanivorans TaxID=2979990 RepID=A0AAP3E3C2_9EURY|nr:hypothetical protein [Halobacteria archaeon AArc-xg1-1]MCU4972894.1 hypothetical protein [Halobacteria archaeon AArc-m2/3/4]